MVFRIFKKCNHSRAVSVYRVLQMQGGGHVDVLMYFKCLTTQGAVPCERLLKIHADAAKKPDAVIGIPVMHIIIFV